MTDRPNYATPMVDPASGLKYITEVGTLKRLYLHPPCDICGISQYSYGTKPMVCDTNCTGRKHSKNDNVHPADQDGHGVMRP